MRVALARGCRGLADRRRRSTKCAPRAAGSRVFVPIGDRRAPAGRARRSRRPPRGNARRGRGRVPRGPVRARGVRHRQRPRAPRGAAPQHAPRPEDPRTAHAARTGARAVARRGARRSRAPARADAVGAVGRQPLRRVRLAPAACRRRRGRRAPRSPGTPAWLDELDRLGRRRARWTTSASRARCSRRSARSGSRWCSRCARRRARSGSPPSAAGPAGRPYTEADREFGTGVVAQAVVAFENAWHQTRDGRAQAVRARAGAGGEHPEEPLPGRAAAPAGLRPGGDEPAGAAGRRRLLRCAGDRRARARRRAGCSASRTCRGRASPRRS